MRRRRRRWWSIASFKLHFPIVRIKNGLSIVNNVPTVCGVEMRFFLIKKKLKSLQ
jgi:hypothetical protein